MAETNANLGLLVICLINKNKNSIDKTPKIIGVNRTPISFRPKMAIEGTEKYINSGARDSEND